MLRISHRSSTVKYYHLVCCLLLQLPFKQTGKHTRGCLVSSIPVLFADFLNPDWCRTVSEQVAAQHLAQQHLNSSHRFFQGHIGWMWPFSKCYASPCFYFSIHVCLHTTSHHLLCTRTSQAMDAVDGRRPPFPPHCYGNGGDTRDTDTQAPSSGDSSPSPQPCSSDLLHSPDGSPCSAEEIDKGVPFTDTWLTDTVFSIEWIKGKLLFKTWKYIYKSRPQFFFSILYQRKAVITHFSFSIFLVSCYMHILHKCNVRQTTLHTIKAGVQYLTSVVELKSCLDLYFCSLKNSEGEIQTRPF